MQTAETTLKPKVGLYLKFLHVCYSACNGNIVISIVRVLCDLHQNQTDWSKFLMWAEYAQNSLQKPATGMTPFKCVLGNQPPLFSVSQFFKVFCSVLGMTRCSKSIFFSFHCLHFSVQKCVLCEWPKRKPFEGWRRKHHVLWEYQNIVQPVSEFGAGLFIWPASTSKEFRCLGNLFENSFKQFQFHYFNVEQKLNTLLLAQHLP